MPVTLIGLGIISLAELLLWTAPLWKERRIAAPLFGIVLALGSLSLLAQAPGVWTGLVAVFSVYRCLNLARVAAGRIQADFLFHSSRRTSLWLIWFQILVIAAHWISDRYVTGTAIPWTAASYASLAAALIILITSARHLKASRAPRITSKSEAARLPTLTVAIPARNETTDLEECLRSLVDSTYPKLEILVLDDCSQDKRTPEIIRGWAHAGVRFMAGGEPPESWLAKNYAYDQLADAANGELLLFCGVDVRFQPGSLDALVRLMMDDGKDMISILPRNDLPKGGGISAWFMQASRYAWELALPRSLTKRPPVLSTCWLISRHALKRAGGFEGVRRKGVPESYLARSTARAGKYRFVISDGRIGITSVKSSEEQRATAVRTRYLQLHRRPELAALVTLAELGVLLLPLGLAISGLAARQPYVALTSGLAFILETLVYARLVDLTYRRRLIRSVWLLPFAAAYDAALLNYSMWRYEFGEVIWKGRNVCIPVMRVVPSFRAEAAPTVTAGSARRR